MFREFRVLPSGSGFGHFSDLSHPAGGEILPARPVGSASPVNYLNHSCDPNCYMIGTAVYAKDRIERGTELTVDYRKVQFGFPGPGFECACGARRCAGRIAGGVAV